MTFYLKLTYHNIKNSKNVFAPFLMTGIVLYTTLCSLTSILFSPIGNDTSYSGITLGLGIVVLTIFSLIMQIYSYNFLMKQRSHELGLYHILGMNRKQVVWLSSLELFYLYVIIFLLGNLFSAVFSHLLYLIFVNITHYHDLSFPFSILPFVVCTLIFIGSAFVLEVIGICRIGLTSSLNLFKQEKQGEKEPKGNIILAFLSIVCLGIGYFLSLSSAKIAALAVVMRFFVAVIFVILGTYLFYISFIAWYFKKRKANKKYYYQPEHFITTSQMLFRMKQNAVGLANITILAVMSFVTIATTTALYANTQNDAYNVFPKNTKITFDGNFNGDNSEFLSSAVLEPLGISESQVTSYQTNMISFSITTDPTITVTEDNVLNPDYSSTGFVYLVTQDDFRKLGNDLPQQLAENETAFYVQKGNSHLKTLNLLGTTYTNIANLKSVEFPDVVNTYNPGLLVVSNQDVMDSIVDSFNQIYNGGSLINQFTVMVDLSDEQFDDAIKTGVFAKDYVDKNGNPAGVYLETRQNYLNETYNLTGSFLFTGFLLGISFLLGAALIIYYKQYSEGHEDRHSYLILQEVGMDKKSVRKTVNSQVVIVFFLPLALATLHFGMVLVMIKQMLLLLGVTSSNLVFSTCIITILLIALVYLLIYKLTSKTYFAIIQR